MTTQKYNKMLEICDIPEVESVTSLLPSLHVTYQHEKPGPRLLNFTCLKNTYTRTFIQLESNLNFPTPFFGLMNLWGCYSVTIIIQLTLNKYSVVLLS